ncbi:FAD-binding oxidoreductase [Litorihabitans aurantiacus]|uniref:FAD-binding oxidoreductase n=1 Tax=Litorihabitans aurantiacus TaxID=1930061 RepID=UPI0024E0D60C|nr:FAD-binding protein [Litorihabitans aurantiacus]
MTRDSLTTDLRDRLEAGTVHEPGEDAHVAALDVWNGAVVATPRAVVRPTSANQVAEAVAVAVEHDASVSVRGGGHDWLGRAVDGEVVLDLSGMRGVEVRGDLATVGGGATAADLAAEAARHGMLAVTGTAGRVGLAGLTLGGGYGPLLGAAGLAADRLVAAEVVLADGVVVRTQDDPELLWALRGGGGNLGVVTEMTLRLHPGDGLVGGVLMLPWEGARGVLSRFADLLADCPEELTVLLELTVVPETGPGLLVVPVWSGDPARAEEALERVRALGEAVADTVAPIDQPALLEQFDQQVPAGMGWHIATRTIAEVDDAVATLLAGALERGPGPGIGVGLRPFHGAATRVPPSDSAVGRRDPHVVLEISAGWPADGDGAPQRAWVEEVWAALEPHALEGGYPNFLSRDRVDQVASAYGANLERLLEVKRRYDPAGVFTGTPLPPHEV